MPRSVAAENRTNSRLRKDAQIIRSELFKMPHQIFMRFNFFIAQLRNTVKRTAVLPELLLVTGRLYFKTAKIHPIASFPDAFISASTSLSYYFITHGRK